MTISTARPDLAGRRVRVRSEVREREHRHARHDAEAPGELGGQQGDLRQLLGVGVDVHRGVGEEEEPVLEDQDVGAGDPVHSLAGCG